MYDKLAEKIILILADFFKKLSMTQIFMKIDTKKFQSNKITRIKQTIYSLKMNLKR